MSLAEFQANLHPSARAKICEKVNAGWHFDPERWAQAEDPSTSHYAAQAKVDLQGTFAQFDTDGSGALDMREFMRAFRAVGLSKRSGEKLEVDEAMFRSFDQK